MDFKKIQKGKTYLAKVFGKKVKIVVTLKTQMPIYRRIDYKYVDFWYFGCWKGCQLSETDNFPNVLCEVR